MIRDITMKEIIHGLANPDNDIHLLMFYGTTCGPCKATMPHYEAVAKFYTERGARIKFYRINAWEPQEQAVFCREKLGVNGVPTFRAYCKSQQFSEKVGGGDEETMKLYVHGLVDDAFKRFGEKI